MTTATTSLQQTQNLKLGYMALLVVCLVWGSTHLAIRIAVNDNTDSLQPITMGTIRMLSASAIIFGIAYFMRLDLKITLKEIWVLLPTALLIWFLGNGLMSVAETKVASNFTALVSGSGPLWSLFFESCLKRKRPSGSLIAVFLLVSVGLLVMFSDGLTLPVFSGFGWVHLALLCSSLCYAGGVVFYHHFGGGLAVHPLVSSGYQHLFAGVAFLFVGGISGQFLEPLPVAPTAWFALGYLILFGSIIGYSSFLFASRHLPMTAVMCTAYTNPILASVLGFLVLGEQVSANMLFGGGILLLCVWVVFSYHPPHPPSKEGGSI